MTKKEVLLGLITISITVFIGVLFLSLVMPTVHELVKPIETVIRDGGLLK